MDMLFSDEDLSFREEVRAFFKENLPETVREVVRRTPSYVSKSDMVAWHKALYRRGWIAPAWPVEYGGIGWSVTQRHIFEEEYSANDAPRISGFGITMVGPVITLSVLRPRRIVTCRISCLVMNCGARAIRSQARVRIWHRCRHGPCSTEMNT